MNFALYCVQLQALKTFFMAENQQKSFNKLEETGARMISFKVQRHTFIFVLARIILCRFFFISLWNCFKPKKKTLLKREKKKDKNEIINPEKRSQSSPTQRCV